MNLSADLEATDAGAGIEVATSTLQVTGGNRRVDTNVGAIMLDEIADDGSNRTLTLDAGGTGAAADITIDDNVASNGSELGTLAIEEADEVLFSGAAATVDVQALTIGTPAVNGVTFDGVVRADGPGASGISANAGATINANFTTGGQLDIDTDTNMDAVGDLTLAGGVTVSTGGNPLNLTVADFVFGGGAGTNSGGADTTVTASSNNDIGLGATALGGGALEITNAEIAALSTSGTLVIQNKTGSGNLIAVNDADAGATDLQLISEGTINDTDDVGPNLETTGTLTLTSSGEIGNTVTGAEGLNIDASAVNITATGGNNVTLTDTTTGSTGTDYDTGTAAATGDVTITHTANNDDIIVVGIDATGGTVTLDAQDSGIQDDTSSATPSITASSVILDAGDGIGDVDALELSQVATLNVEAAKNNTGGIDIDNASTAGVTVQLLTTGSGNGAIVYDQTGANTLGLTMVDSADGAINVTAAGTVAATSVVSSTTNADANDITIETSAGDIDVTLVNAGTTDGDVFLSSAAGAVNGPGTNGTPDVSGEDIEIVASTGIGAGTLDIDGVRLAATTVTGNIDIIDNAGGLTIDSLNVDGAGGSTDGVSITGAGGGFIILRTSSPMTVMNDITTASAGDVTLAALGAALGDSLDIQGDVSSQGGGVNLYAGDSIDIAAGNIVSTTGAGAILVSAGTDFTGDAAANGNAAGNVDMGDGAFVNSDSGTITVRAPEGVALSIVDADADAMGAAGNVVVDADFDGPDAGLSDSSGAITDSTTGDGTPNVTGNDVTLIGPTGIGGSTATSDIDVAVGGLLDADSSGMNADLNVQAGENGNVGPALVLDAITAGGGEVTIGARNSGAVTQNGGGSIIGTGLELRGAGDFTLTSTTNAIDTLVGDFMGTLSFLDSDGYNIDNAGAIGTLGLNSDGNNITLDTNTAGATIDQANSSPIQASGLELLNGTFDLTSNSDNDITTLAASTTFDFVYREGSTSTGFVVGAVGGTVGITTTGEVQLNAQAGTVTQSDIITADDLELRGGGSFLLDDANNNITNFFAVRTGAGDVSFTNVGAIDVNSVGGTDGITRTGGDVQLTAGGAGTVTINQAIALGGGDLGINSSGAVTQFAAIGGGGLQLVGTGPFTLQDPGNAFTTLAASTTGAALPYRDSNALIIGTVDLTAIGGVSVSGVNTGGNEFALRTGGNVTQTAAASGSNLQVVSGGTVNLSNGGNAFAIVAVDGTTGATYRDTNAVTVGTVNTTVGVTTNSGTASVTSGGVLTLTDPVTASSGNVVLNSISANITGAALVSGNALDADAATGININTAVASADARVSGAGAIDIDETNSISLTNAITSNGGVDVRTTSGNLVASNVVAGAAGNVILMAGGSGNDVTVTNVNAAGNNVTITAADSIISNSSVISENLLLTATGTGGAGDIGSSASPLGTTTTGSHTITAAGDVFINETTDFATSEIASLSLTGGAQTVLLQSEGTLTYDKDLSGDLNADTLSLNGAGATAWSADITDLSADDTIVFFDRVDLVGSRSARSAGTLDFRSGILGGTGESVTFNVDKVELSGGVQLAGATNLANAPILTFNSAVDVNDSQTWRIDRLRSSGVKGSISAANTGVVLTVALTTRDDSRVVTIGGATDELMRGSVVDAFDRFGGEVAIGANTSANTFTATFDALPGQIIVDGRWQVSNSPGTITLVSLGDIVFTNNALLTAETINLIALGANPDSLGGLVIDQNAAIASQPGFVKTDNLVVVAAGSLGSDSGALGGGLTGTANGIINVASGSDKSFFDNFGNGSFGDGTIALAISEVFNLKLQELGFATTDLSSGLNVSGLQTGGLEVDAEVDEGVSESLFLLTSIIDASNGLLLPPQMNPSLPERPDDPGVENPDPDDPDQMAIDEEWQVFYNEDLIEFLVSEGYVLADDEGEVLPEEQALLEQYLDELIALYENIRAQERLILAAELSEFEDEEGLFDDGEEGFEDEDLEFEDDSDLLEDELDIDIDLDEEGAGLSDEIEPSAAIAAQTPVNLARLGHAGDSWSDGGLGVDGTWYSRLGEAWSRAFD